MGYSMDIKAIVTYKVNKQYGMKQTKWFDKKFDFDFKQNTFPSTLKRLKESPQNCVQKLKSFLIKS